MDYADTLIGLLSALLHGDTSMNIKPKQWVVKKITAAGTEVPKEQLVLSVFSSGSLQPSRTPPEILTPVHLSPAKCDAGLFVWPAEWIPIYQFYVRSENELFHNSI